MFYQREPEQRVPLEDILAPLVSIASPARCTWSYPETDVTKQGTRDGHSFNKHLLHCYISRRTDQDRRLLSLAIDKRYPKCPWPECEYALLNQNLDLVAKHIATHIPRHSTQCPWSGCGERASSEDALQLHLLQHHSVPVPTTLPGIRLVALQSGMRSAMELDTNLISTHISQLLGERFSAASATPISGGEYSIIMLIDKSGEKRVSVRIPKASPSAITSLRVDLEAQIRKRIDDAKLDRFQPLLTYDITVDNPICHPFMVLGWADGRRLEWSATTPKCAAQREGVLRAIANTSLDLLQVQQPGVSAWNWMTNKIDRKIARAERDDLPFGTKAQCEQQKSLMQRYWIPDLDDCPHVLVHGDLSSQNIIVDDDFAVRKLNHLRPTPGYVGFEQEKHKTKRTGNSTFPVSEIERTLRKAWPMYTINSCPGRTS
ncbi:hypothetical protein BST61_g8659 [Cercospora zeina]